MTRAEAQRIINMLRRHLSMVEELKQQTIKKRSEARRLAPLSRRARGQSKDRSDGSLKRMKDEQRQWHAERFESERD